MFDLCLPLEHTAPWKHGIFSDWTLSISGAVFPVHRYVVGLGPRSSPVLARIFQSSTFSDQIDRSTSIDLQYTCPGAGGGAGGHLSIQECQSRFQSAAECILSYMYLDVDCCTPLHLHLFMPIWRLADYLCLYSLIDQIKSALTDMVGVDNIADVLKDAEYFGLADECAQICARRIARRFTFIKNDVWDRLPPKFLSEILRSPRLLAPGNYVSERLALYLQRHESAREHHDLLVRSLLDNPRHQISPQDGAFFLSLNVRHDSLVDLVAEHFQMFPRSHLCQLDADLFITLIRHPALKSAAEPNRFLELTLLSYVRTNLSQLSADHLAVILHSVSDLSLRVKLIVHIVYSPDSYPAAIDVCIMAILDAIQQGLVPGPVRRLGDHLVSIGYGIWIQTEPNAEFLAFEAPSSSGNTIQLYPVHDGKQDQKIVIRSPTSTCSLSSSSI